MRRANEPIAGSRAPGRAVLAAWVAAALLLLAAAPLARTQAPAHPERLSDPEFWRLVSDMSEPSGYFQSDNLVSNELTFQWVIPELLEQQTGPRAYLGVGPDQNFTYLAALEPAVAFIVDIRRDNLRLQLLYKALFELSPTRAVFLSRLFSRDLPDALPEQATVVQLMAAFRSAPPSQERFRDTLKMVDAHLREAHGFTITPEDSAGMEYVLSAFLYAGPLLTYGNTGRMGRYPTYEDLMEASDRAGELRGYLASETLYGRLRALQLRNLVVPVVGDFAGPKAIREVAAYLKAHRLVVGTIYTSNVEQYLFQYGTWKAYYDNVATLPVDEASTFVRSCFNACVTTTRSRSAQLLDPVAALLRDVADGRIQSYYDVLAHSR